MNALVINRPNLNMLGIREPDIYGHQTYDDLIELCRAAGEKEGFDTVDVYQSNHEGDLIDTIQQALGVYDGIVINPAAYTHTSVGILDALKAVQIPALRYISRRSTSARVSDKFHTQAWPALIA